MTRANGHVPFGTFIGCDSVSGIKETRPALSSEWLDIWYACPYATYFHSEEWARLWSAYGHGASRPCPLLVTFSDGVQALLPLSTIRVNNDVWGYSSSPNGEYGGWIAAEQLSRAHAIQMTALLTRSFPRLFWCLNPFDRLVADLEVAGRENIDETHVLDLEPGFGHIFNNWSSACRRAWRKARRSGIRVRWAESKADWQAYYKAYEDTHRRWGSQALSKYEWRLFEVMHRLDSDNLRLWLATDPEDQILAGSLVAYSYRHVAYWHGAAFEHSLPARPMNLLFYEIIKDACNRGFKWFDFGPSGGQEGVRRFKAGFGSDSLPISMANISHHIRLD